VGYFGGGDVLGQAAGLGFGKGGLLARTDSREHMRSRASSPKRREGKRRDDME
jgi:Golgi apyrase